jgi:ADP-ribose pyrophosphatase
MKNWIEKSRKLVTKAFVFNYSVVEYESPQSGRTFPYDVVELKGDCINIVPQTTDGKFIMVKQFRAASAEIAIEFPAGMVDKNEHVKIAALRELSEETGSKCSEIFQSGFSKTNPALLVSDCYHFIAKGCERIGPQNLDEREEIEIVEYSEQEIDDLIAIGKINHALSISAWYFYKQNK